MAGIGFALRKLAQRDNLSGVLRGFAHSAFITSGPWIFTITAATILTVVGQAALGRDGTAAFRATIIYNFCFSAVFTGPFILPATRHLADRIYERAPESAPTLLVAVLGAIQITAAAIALPFHLLVTDLGPAGAIAATANFALIGGLWAATIFLTALRDHIRVTLAFLAGMAAGCATGAFAAQTAGPLGMIWGFNIGLAVIEFGLIARVLIEYPHDVGVPLGTREHLRRHWELPLIGTLAAAAVWVDKWIMWFSPLAETEIGGMPTAPLYDSALFAAYLTTLPALTLFTIGVETGFFERYQAFYRGLREHATWDRISSDHRAIIESVLASTRTLAIVQGTATAAAVLAAPAIIGLLRFGNVGIGVFRLAAVGAFLQVAQMFGVVILSYFDLKRRQLWAQGVFLVANGGCTALVSLFLGKAWTGFGFLAGSAIAFAVVYVMVADALRRLPYLAFVASNPSIE